MKRLALDSFPCVFDPVLMSNLTPSPPPFQGVLSIFFFWTESRSRSKRSDSTRTRLETTWTEEMKVVKRQKETSNAKQLFTGWWGRLLFASVLLGDSVEQSSVGLILKIWEDSKAFHCKEHCCKAAWRDQDTYLSCTFLTENLPHSAGSEQHYRSDRTHFWKQVGIDGMEVGGNISKN